MRGPYQSASAHVVTFMHRSGYYRLERQLPGGIRTRKESAPFHGAHNTPSTLRGHGHPEEDPDYNVDADVLIRKLRSLGIPVPAKATSPWWHECLRELEVLAKSRGYERAKKLQQPPKGGGPRPPILSTGDNRRGSCHGTCYSFAEPVLGETWFSSLRQSASATASSFGRMTCGKTLILWPSAFRSVNSRPFRETDSGPPIGRMHLAESVDSSRCRTSRPWRLRPIRPTHD